MSKVGKYRGVHYLVKRHCDVFPYSDSPRKTKFYFAEHWDHELSGDHFATLREFKEWVDNMNPTDRAQFLPSPGQNNH